MDTFEHAAADFAQFAVKQDYPPNLLWVKWNRQHGINAVPRAGPLRQSGSLGPSNGKSDQYPVNNRREHEPPNKSSVDVDSHGQSSGQ